MYDLNGRIVLTLKISLFQTANKNPTSAEPSVSCDKALPAKRSEKGSGDENECTWNIPVGDKLICL